MIHKDVESLLIRQSRRHIFSRLRGEVRWIIAPFYVCFAFVDYIYLPERFLQWFCLRLVLVITVFALFELLKISKIRRQYSQEVAIAVPVVACNIINVMIAQSGGSESLYILGLVLVAITGNQIFRLTRKGVIIANSLSYGPSILIMYFTAAPHQWPRVFIQSSFLVGMTYLSWIFTSSDEQVVKIWASSRINLSNALEKLRKTEFLKRHFPPQLRKLIEDGEVKLSQRKIISTAVVGFADITSSTKIANQVGLVTDWEIKERFLEAATKRATQCGLIVLTHVGDGFLFLCNYDETTDWPVNVVSFFETLLADFEVIKLSLSEAIGPIETGIKCGLAMGPVIVGFIGKDQSYFTAMGPDVNLASRLTAKARNNEMIISSRIWYVLRNLIIGWTTQEEKFTDLKGFEGIIPAVRLSPRTMGAKTNLCPVCQEGMSVVRTLEGYIDVVCPNKHEGAEKKVRRIAS